MKNIISLPIIAITLSLIGCGGGGTSASTPPDTTAPTMVALAASGTTDHATNLSVTIDENGTGYYLVQASTASAPAASAVMAASAVALTANVPASQAISGLAFNTPYNIYFVAKDAANNVQSAVQSVPVTTLLTPGYQVQGGLTWSPPNTYGSGPAFGPWIYAENYCTTSTINGLTGWRLPTLTELTALAASGNTYVSMYWTGMLWSSTPGTAGTHWAVYMTGGSNNISDGFNSEITCVR